VRQGIKNPEKEKTSSPLENFFFVRNPSPFPTISTIPKFSVVASFLIGGHFSG